MRRKRKFLIVSKDNGGAAVGVPLALEAKTEHEVVAEVEGLAAKRYKAAGIDLRFQGTENFQEEPFSVDAARAIEKIKPDAIITTLGDPIYLEREFGRAANLLGKPLIFLEDLWGCHCRSDAQPDLVLTPDANGESILRKNFGSGVPAAIVGHHEVRSARDLKIPGDLYLKMTELKARYGAVLLCVGGGPYTTAELNLLKQCLEKTPHSPALIFRPHPKWAKVESPSGLPFGTVWQDMLRDLGDQVQEVETSVPAAIAALADATLSGFSTMLITTVVYQRSAISLATAETRADMKRQLSVDQYPLAASGLIREIARPEDLMPYLEGPKPSREAIHECLKPYDPRLALSAVVEFLDQQI